MAEDRQFVSLILGKEKFGINIMDIKEIIRPMDITVVPKAPSFVEGIINLRGKVIPIVDLRKKLGIQADEMNNDSRIIVVNINNRQLGFVVNSVDQVLRLEENLIDDAPGMSAGYDENYIEGVAKTRQGMIIILDVKKIFSTGEQSALNNF